MRKKLTLDLALVDIPTLDLPAKGELLIHDEGVPGLSLRLRATGTRTWIVRSSQSGMPDACDAVRLLLLTGGRRQEILGLRWDAIVGRRAVLADAKEGPRTIWLNTPAKALLDERRERIAGEYVFPSKRLDGPKTNIDREWKAIRVHADIPGLRLHDLRHHFAAVGVSNGIDLKMVGQLLGHKEIEAWVVIAAMIVSVDRILQVRSCKASPDSDTDAPGRFLLILMQGSLNSAPWSLRSMLLSDRKAVDLFAAKSAWRALQSCAATTDEVKDLRRETLALKECVADLTLANRLLKKRMARPVCK